MYTIQPGTLTRDSDKWIACPQIDSTTMLRLAESIYLLTSPTEQPLVTQKIVATPNEIRDALEDDIVSRRLMPGEKLDEIGLANRFKVSRTPIREALRYLAASGLVELVPNRGAFVSELSIPRLVEMFEVMAGLEGMCGRLAARRMTSEMRGELQAAHGECRIAGVDGLEDAYYYSNATFHDIIYKGSGNAFLIDQVRLLRRRLKPYRRIQLQVPKRLAESFEEHQAIVDAIVAGDEQLADTCLREHLLIQGERFNDFVALVNQTN